MMRHLLFSALLALLATVSLEADIINVPPGANLQSQIDAALSGDEIVLQAGAVYTGPFTLGPKNGPGEIVIRSSAISQMPPGSRVSPAKAALMPQLVSASDVVVQVVTGAHGYRLAGLEITPAPGRFVNDLVRIGSGQERTVAEQPQNITIERSYLHGDSRAGTRRGVAMNGVNNTIVDSYVSDCKAVDVDSQAVAGWNGAGPYAIRNNYLEASGENIMFGGADPAVGGLIPANIKIEGNHLRKPASWKVSDPSYAGTHWTVKNLLELKNARQVLIDNNILEDNWADAQEGYAVVITPRNEGGGSPWAAVEDVQFTNNVVRRAVHGMVILGYDNFRPSGQTRRLTIRNNVFEDISGALFEIIDAARDIVIEHNTGVRGTMALSASAAVPAGNHTGERTANFVFRNNLTVKDEGGILGFPIALSKYFPDAIVERNAFIGGGGANYPANNLFPPSLEAVGFTDAASGNYRLNPSSSLKAAGSDGKDVGVVYASNTAAFGVGNSSSGGEVSPMPAVATSPQAVSEVEGPVIRAGYVVVTPDTGVSAPLTSALVGRVQNGQVLSETTVFAPQLATSAAMFVDVAPAIGRNMGLALANPHAASTSITLRLIDASGGMTGAPKVITLEPYAQVARFLNEFFQDMPSAAFTGSLTIESTAPAALMGFRFAGTNFSVIAIDNTSGPSPMPVRNGSIGGTAAAMFPQFAVGGGWASQLMLLNRTPGVISGRVDVFDPAGNPMSVTLNNVTSSTFRYSIPAGGTLLLAPRDLNGQSAL